MQFTQGSTIVENGEHIIALAGSTVLVQEGSTVVAWSGKNPPIVGLVLSQNYAKE